MLILIHSTVLQNHFTFLCEACYELSVHVESFSVLRIVCSCGEFRLPSVDVSVMGIECNVTFVCLHRKDPSAFFSFPVTDFIAPGYSMIIKHPMDFSTMKEKIKNNDYQSIEELKVIVFVYVFIGDVDRMVIQSNIIY